MPARFSNKPGRPAYDDYLVMEAKKRNLTRADLVIRLVDVIKRDQLVSAILDDGEQLNDHGPSRL
jgi:hypothetical protein